MIHIHEFIIPRYSNFQVHGGSFVKDMNIKCLLDVPLGLSYKGIILLCN